MSVDEARAAEFRFPLPPPRTAWRVRWPRRIAGRAMLLAAATAAILFGSAANAAGKAAAFHLRDLDGHVLELNKLRQSGPVLIEFWATWCGPCRAVFPELEALRREYADCGLTILGVSVDGPRNVAKVRPFVARERLTFPVAIDLDGRLQQLYQVSQLPTAVLIDTSGAIVYSRVGYRPGEASLGEHVAALCPHTSARADTAASGR
jgi:peroxiredoxin